MERPALFVGDAEEGAATLNEDEVRERMRQGVPPESAEEYLLRVRIESSDLPAVVEAHVPEVLKKKQTLYMPSTEPVPTCPASLLPSEEWEREVVSTFVDLRQYLRRWKATGGVSAAERQPVPALKDSTGWHIFCLGYTEDEEDEEVVESEIGSVNGSVALALSSSEPHQQQQQQQSHSVSAAAAAASGARDPRNDDDAQSSYCIAPVETSSRFDKFTSTLARTSEAAPQEEREQEEGSEVAADGDKDKDVDNPKPVSAASTAATTAATAVSSSSSPTAAGGVVGGAGGGRGVGGGGEGGGGPVVEAGKRATGKDWLQTHPHGTPPTMRLAMQFDQVLTQRVLAFHADWLRDNLLSRARAVWIYTLLACLEKPLGSETAALVREVLRRCCAQRAEVESPLDDNLPALNVIVAIAGRFFQQAEVA